MTGSRRDQAGPAQACSLSNALGPRELQVRGPGPTRMDRLVGRFRLWREAWGLLGIQQPWHSLGAGKASKERHWLRETQRVRRYKNKELGSCVPGKGPGRAKAPKWQPWGEGGGVCQE